MFPAWWNFLADDPPKFAFRLRVFLVSTERRRRQNWNRWLVKNLWDFFGGAHTVWKKFGVQDRVLMRSPNEGASGNVDRRDLGDDLKSFTPDIYLVIKKSTIQVCIEAVNLTYWECHHNSWIATTLGSYCQRRYLATKVPPGIKARWSYPAIPPQKSWVVVYVLPQ